MNGRINDSSRHAEGPAAQGVETELMALDYISAFIYVGFPKKNTDGLA